MINPLDIFDKAANVVDDNVYSNQEAETERTKRLAIDMASDNVLSKLIRPIITIYSGLIWGAIHIASLWFTVPDTISWSVSAVFSACIGFYFNSKRQERLTEKKGAAAIKLELMKTKQELRQNRRNKQKQINK
jgi:hypothetical protein